MKSLLKSTRNKRKSVNEKSSKSSSSGAQKTTSRSGSRLAAGRTMFDARNKSTDSDLNSTDGTTAVNSSIPPFARSPPAGQNSYGLKPKGQRESKASSAIIEPSRRSLDSHVYDNISEYSKINNGSQNQNDPDSSSIISDEEPVGKQFVSPTSPVHRVKSETPSVNNDETMNKLSSSMSKTTMDAESNEQEALNSNTEIDDPTAASSANENKSSSSVSLGSNTNTNTSNITNSNNEQGHLFSSGVNQKASSTNNTNPSAQQFYAPNQPNSGKSQEQRQFFHQKDEATGTKKNENDLEIKSTQSNSTKDDTTTLVSKTNLSHIPTTTTNATASTASAHSPLNGSNYDHVIFKSGWINRGTNMTSWSSSVTSDTWRLYRAELKGSNLLLFKPPSDLGIKHFEPRYNGQGEMRPPEPYSADNASGLSPSNTIIEEGIARSSASVDGIQSQHYDNMDNKSTINNNWSNVTADAGSGNVNIRLPGGFPSKSEISYVSEVYPHPDLQFDEADTILNGSLEAVCHTVLFNTSEDSRLSSQLISVIPLFGDAKIAVDYFVQYAFVFMSPATVDSLNSKIKSFKFPLHASLLNRKNVSINETTDSIITNRLGLVVSIIQEQFPGMLMDAMIFEKLLTLLELIGVHNDAFANELNRKIISQQQKMTELLVFDAASASKAITKEESVLTADEFLKIDLNEFSDQINLIDLKFNKEWNPKTDASLLYETGYSYSRYNPLIFDPVSNIHYLGRILIQHLFEDDQSKASVQFRAKVIQKWVELGSIFDKKGDMVSWLAIATIICSIPILRLKKTWSVVDSKTLKIVSTEWGQVVFELDRRNMTSDAAHRSSYHVIAPQGIGESYSKFRVVPYFGDLTVKLTSSNITLKQCEKRVQRVKISFNRWDEYLAMVKEKNDFGALQTPNPKTQRLLYNLLSIHVGLSRLTQDDVMQQSLEVEPSNSSSLYEFYSSYENDKPPISAGIFFPILFTDFLPSYRLFDKDSLIQAAGGHGSKRGGEVTKIQAVTGVNIVDSTAIHHHYKLRRSSPLADSIFDLLNIDSDVFHVGKDLIFKAVPKNNILSADGNSKNDENNGNISHKPVVVNVVAKASSFEKLVDILVLTPNIFNAHINEEDMQKYLTKHNLSGGSIKLDMDIGVYTETFFASYKSFCNLTTLIEGLGRRFIGAKAAAISIKKSKDNKEYYAAHSERSFPDWDSSVESNNPEINWKYVAQIEAGILEALYALISDFYSDFTDEIETKQSFVDILKIIDQEIVNEWKTILKQHSDGHDELYELYENLQLLYKKIRKFYIKRSYRPLDFYSTPHTFSSVVDFPPDHAHLPPSSQFVEIQKLIEKLDVVVFDLFRQTTVNEWMVVSDLFEMQSTRSLTGIFSYKQHSPAISEEDLKIFNVFSWLESLYVDVPEVKLLSKFPSNIRALYGLHGKITSYFLNQIIEPRIPLSKRRNRMTTILQMLAIINCRMQSCSVFADEGSRIPAFLETCIAMAVCAPESRWFVNDWIYSALKLRSRTGDMKWDTLSDLVPSFNSKILLKDCRAPLTPCFGWLAERLLEVGCYIPNVSVENPSLLNFDKRRYVYKLIHGIMALKREDSLYSKEELNDIKKKFEFLYNIKRSVYDLRDIREIARKENKDYPRNEQKNKLFQRLVEQEFYKLKRDVNKKESLEMQELKRKQINSKMVGKPQQTDSKDIATMSRSNMNVGISNSTSTNSIQQNAVLNAHTTTQAKGGGRFRIGGFLKAVRPFSINVGNSWSAPERVASISELPDPAIFEGRSGKAALQFKLFNMKPLIIHSSDIEGFFKLVDVEGQEYCFQATSDVEANDWVKNISEAKRYGYLSQEAKERNGNKVFGVPIQLVCKRENNVIPYVVHKLLDEIERRGLDEVGLYRVPGAVANIQLLKQRFDESAEEVSLEDQRFLEINTLAGCFKLYLRELPESLLTSELLPSFISVTSGEDIVDGVCNLIKRLPFHNYHLLKKLVTHLNLVTEHSDKNRMDASNLAMVFSMSFLSSSDTDFTRSLGSLQSILLMMIQEPERYFKNAEYDAAVSSFEQ
ncbi:GTPase-activating protein [Saccharomycopsis crataegensis]|uniref:GTPase-activating protein n=1 Tax=Saccharomycopsis crataegensis TaxID=43959 RepID=A0AAV5QVJ7_9ASCO|nr:GTPase-activating protein [Saccharomycopsis crataegensis]